MAKFQADPRTDADVRRLMQVFQDVRPDGRLVAHPVIEAALTMPRASSRYRTVMAKWRRVMQDERGVYLDGLSAEGLGFIALAPDEMVRFANRGVRASGRKLRRALVVAYLPDDEALSPEIRRYRGQLAGAFEKIAHEHRAALRQVSQALAPMRQLPKMSV